MQASQTNGDETTIVVDPDRRSVSAGDISDAVLLTMPSSPHTPHRRRNSLDNADLSVHGVLLEQADMDIDNLSLPSLDHYDDDKDEPTAGISDVESLSYLLDSLGGISEESPAAAALRANAEIKVNRASKLARSIHAQSLRRMVKRATLRGKSGVVRGKPPRIPPHISGGAVVLDQPRPQEATLGSVQEEEVESVGDSSNASSADSVGGLSDHSDHVEAMAKGASKHFKSLHIGDALEPLVVDDHHHHDTSLEHLEQKVHDVTLAAAETGKKALHLVQHTDEKHRWKLRKRSGKKRDRNKSYVKGKVINGEHELYTLSIAVMLGVRTSIGRTNLEVLPSSSQEKTRWISEKDYVATEKYTFRPKGGPKTPPHQLTHTFKFKDYSPKVFLYLRRMFGVNEFDFLLSVCGNANFIEFISNAKSGQFFFYSSDGKYMIKTMTNAESKFLRRILPHYVRHCAENPNTLMTKFLGMYRVKMYHLRRNVKFVIMNSVYHTDKYLQSFYDLKGSTAGRDAKPHHDVKKDNDMRRGQPNSAIALTPVTRTRVREQIVADCTFMERMSIMDYSMLIGIHHVPHTEGDPQKQPQEDPVAGQQLGFTIGSKNLSFRGEDRSFRDLVGHHATPAVHHPTHHSLPVPTTQREASHVVGGRPTTPVVASAPPNVSTDTASNEDRGVKFDSAAYEKYPSMKFDPAAHEKHPSIRSIDGLSLGENAPDFPDLHATCFREFEHGYDDDDDDSYLEGSENHLRSLVATGSGASTAEQLKKKEQRTERIYRPFHAYYDIHGHRRMLPGTCPTCGGTPCDCPPPEEAASWKVPAFVPPLSDRKDGGLVADMTGVEVPQTFRSHGKELPYDGKIFYMGIIDILQEYSVRKRVEANYRRAKGTGWEGASCVHPTVYADRFIRFFDEYSRRQTP